MPHERTINVKQLASALGVSEKTVRRMITAGEVETTRIGSGRGRLAIRESEVQRLLHISNLTPALSNADRMVQWWMDACGTTDPAVALHWVAEGAVEFAARYPHIVELEPWSSFVRPRPLSREGGPPRPMIRPRQLRQTGTGKA